MDAPRFGQVDLPAACDVIAPDGSEVRILAGLPGASTAHFTLPAGAVSGAVVHRTVSEIWFVLAGRGRMWRSQDGVAAELDLRPGISLTIPVGTVFQFRSEGPGPLAVLGVTTPPWPGDDEAVAAEGPWAPAGLGMPPAGRPD